MRSTCNSDKVLIPKFLVGSYGSKTEKYYPKKKKDINLYSSDA